MSQWSDQRQVQDRCPRFPLDTNKPCCRAQPAAITLLLNYLFYISTILPPLPTTIKKICKEQIKMKFNIGLGKAMTLPLARKNWLFSPPFPSPRLSSRAIGRSLGEKAEGVFPQVFFMRWIFYVNHLTTTLRNFISIGATQEQKLRLSSFRKGYADACRQVKFLLASFVPKWSVVFASRNITGRLRSASHGTRGLVQYNRPISFGYVICL